MHNSAWNWLSELGIDAQTDPGQAKRIRLTNRVAVVGAFLILHQPWYYLRLGLVLLGWVHLFTILALLLVPLLNAQRRSLQARVMLFVLVDINIVFVGMINGLGTGDELALLVTMPAAFMFFDIRRERVLLWTMVVGSVLAFCLLWWLDFDPFAWQRLSQGSIREAYIVNFLTTAILLILVAVYFMRLSNREVDDVSARGRRQLQTALDHAQDAIFLIDPARMEIIQCNAQAVKRFGAADKAAIEGQPVDLLAWDARGDSERQELEAFRTGQMGQQEREQAYFSLTGERFWGSAAYSQFQYEGQEFILLRITDITSFKESQFALIAAKERAEAANRAKTNFLNNMSHEFRTPINGLLNLATEIRDGVEDEELKEFADHLLESTERLHRTLSLVLDIVRLESGDEALSPSVFYVEDILNRLKQELCAEADRKQLACQIYIGPTGPPLTQLEDLFSLTLGHLLSNAIKFTPTGGAVHFEVKWPEPLPGQAAQVEILIRDTGIGMSAEFMQEHLFTRFIQESEGLNRKYEGAGLGMAIVKKCVDLMEGRIRVRSEKGKGTEFTLSLPVVYQGASQAVLAN